ncbi:MAG: AMP-binding protein, partial [Alphaproteobacteria bacterium]
MKLLGDWLREVAAREGDRDAFVSFPPGRAPQDPRRITYAEWDRRSDAIAAGLAALGLGRGDVLALLLPPRPEYAFCYLGAAKIGVVTTGVNPRFGEAEIDAILRASGARVLVAIASHGGRDLAAVARRVGARLPALDHVFLVADADGEAVDASREVVSTSARSCSRDASVRVPETALLAALE